MQTTTCTMTEEQAKHLNIVIIGLPGSGKGTQSKMVADKYSLVHISSGDLLREQMEKDNALGKEIRRHMEEGILFPDELVNSVFVENVPASDYILDGYPRKLSQIDTFKNVNLVLYLTLSEDEAIERILNRNEGREDDNKDAVKVRLDAFVKKTQPVIERYREFGILHEIDASGSQEDVFDRICGVIQKL
ncbi:adenylate kinase [Pancytospora philotis]|nr:adenylate kinase [Pancytospora philotis]